MAVTAVAPFLMGIAGHLVARVLVALGMSIVTIQGVDVAFGALKEMVVRNVNQLPQTAYALMMISGFGVALNLFFAAITFRLSYWALTRLTGMYFNPR